MTKFILLLALILLGSCGKSKLKPRNPDLELLFKEMRSADQDNDDVLNIDENDRTRKIIQIPKLRPGPNTNVDLTFYFQDGQATLRANSVFGLVEAPQSILDIMAKKIGEDQKVGGMYFEKISEMENCWVFKDLFHPINLTQRDETLLRLSVKIHPEVVLAGMQNLQNIRAMKLRLFSLGADGDIAYLDPSPHWVNDLKEDIVIAALKENESYKGGHIAIDFERGNGLDFLMARKRQLGMCFDDFSYQINQKQRTLAEVIRKAKLSGIGMNYSNGVKYKKYYYVKETNLEDLFKLLGVDFDSEIPGQYVLDSRAHVPFKVADLPNLMEENLQNGPWIFATRTNLGEIACDSPTEELKSFMRTIFQPSAEIGLWALPIYKILSGPYGEKKFTINSSSQNGIEQLQFPKMAPGVDWDFILDARENIPVASGVKVTTVEACVSVRDIGHRDHEKANDCGADYRGLCGIYHRDLEYKTVKKLLAPNLLSTVEVVLGQRHYPLNKFIDQRFTFLDNSGRLHFRFKGPITLESIKLLMPNLKTDYHVRYGFEGFERCEHRNLGSNFRFLNYPGTVDENKKSSIDWQLQTY